MSTKERGDNFSPEKMEFFHLEKTRRWACHILSMAEKFARNTFLHFLCILV
jgi:hypothetical protein